MTLQTLPAHLQTSGSNYDKIAIGSALRFYEQSTDTKASVANFENNVEKQTRLLELLNKLAA